MNKYRNKKTGTVIETSCVIRGGTWEEMESLSKSPTAKNGW